MDVCKAKIQSDGSLDNLILRIVVRGDLQNKELVVDTWSPTSSMINLKYFLSNAIKPKARVNQLYSVGAFLQAKVENIDLLSCILDIQITFQNMQSTLE